MCQSPPISLSPPFLSLPLTPSSPHSLLPSLPLPYHSFAFSQCPAFLNRSMASLSRVIRPCSEKYLCVNRPSCSSSILSSGGASSSNTLSCSDTNAMQPSGNRDGSST
eukprot:TRINITY_DN7625_c0_g1_i1.p2 TRINITY_DN7625_c0_g1~~TRINITY_DN7625_c0_g1_i1.p2  ORF type:complete len:108 (+),score=2.77 TRINITY_DN7625_c0_g1_i1:379-702(+)